MLGDNGVVVVLADRAPVRLLCGQMEIAHHLACDKSGGDGEVEASEAGRGSAARTPPKKRA